MCHAVLCRLFHAPNSLDNRHGQYRSALSRNTVFIFSEFESLIPRMRDLSGPQTPLAQSHCRVASQPRQPLQECEIEKVSLREVFFDCGCSDPRPSYFSLLVQRKVPKRNDTRRLAASRCPARHRPGRGSAEGISYPSAEWTLPCVHPSGHSRPRLRCSAASTGQ